MPIRINLLAEAQEAEEARRRDPVKRALLVSAVLVGLMLLWGGIEFSRTIVVKSELTKHERMWSALEAEFKEIVEKEKQIAQLDGRLDALTRYATNRFLWGTVLNVLQQTTVDQVQFIRLNGLHNYTQIEIQPPKPKEGAAKEGKAPSKVPPKLQSRERISMIIEARDYGNPAEENYNKLKNALFSHPYMRNLVSTRDNIKLKDLRPVPTVDPVSNRPYTVFILECQFTEKVRDE